MNTFLLLATICFDAQCIQFVSDYDLTFDECQARLVKAIEHKKDDLILYECKAEKEYK